VIEPADAVLHHDAIKGKVVRPPSHGSAGVGHHLRSAHLVGMDGMDGMDLAVGDPADEPAIEPYVVDPCAVGVLRLKTAVVVGRKVICARSPLTNPPD
jgi:hypothetical protein